MLFLPEKNRLLTVAGLQCTDQLGLCSPGFVLVCGPCSFVPLKQCDKTFLCFGLVFFFFNNKFL